MDFDSQGADQLKLSPLKLGLLQVRFKNGHIQDRTLPRILQRHFQRSGYSGRTFFDAAAKVDRFQGASIRVARLVVKYLVKGKPFFAGGLSMSDDTIIPAHSSSS